MPTPYINSPGNQPAPFAPNKPTYRPLKTEFMPGYSPQTDSALRAHANRKMIWMQNKDKVDAYRQQKARERALAPQLPALRDKAWRRMKDLQAQPDPGIPPKTEPAYAERFPQGNPRHKGKLFVDPNPDAPLKWHEKRLIGDYVRPFLERVGTPERFGAFAGIASVPLWFLIAKARGLAYPGRKALGLGMVTGGGTKYTSRFNPPFSQMNLGPKQWAASLIPKTGSDINTPTFSKLTLGKAVDDMPGINSTQRSFLHHGISSAPTSGDRAITTLQGLADGFEKSTNNVTGGKIGYVTRAVEGAIIGSAFSNLAGLSPGAKKWTTGITAAVDSLYGNRLFNTLGYFN